MYEYLHLLESELNDAKQRLSVAEDDGGKREIKRQIKQVKRDIKRYQEEYCEIETLGQKAKA